MMWRSRRDVSMPRNVCATSWRMWLERNEPQATRHDSSHPKAGSVTPEAPVQVI